MAMTRKQRRLTIIGLAGAVLVAATGLVVWALSDRIVFFNTPSDILARAPDASQRLRLGGLVETGSIVKTADGTVTFSVTDGDAKIAVVYRGILPDLFRENSGVITEGVVGPGGVFTADTVLAKHDETYMPPEVAQALRERGLWEGEGANGPGAAAVNAAAGAAPLAP